MISYSTNPSHIIDPEGPIDFAFIVHARDIQDILRTYPELSAFPEEEAYVRFSRHRVHVGSRITAKLNGSQLRGELIGVPFVPTVSIRDQLRDVRKSLVHVLDYCTARNTRIVGLGALLPSMTQYGQALAESSDSVGITTGHSFTGWAIARHVEEIERTIGRQSVAIVGAAGSTGRAAILALGNRRSPLRRLTVVDLPERLPILRKMTPLPAEDVVITGDLKGIRECSLVICVTNAKRAIIEPEFLGKDCIVIDDAQPENISVAATRKRPDVVVIKCLAKIPGLQLPFDFGFFQQPREHEEIAFTCLAEVIALAASRHSGHFTLGVPTNEMINHIGKVATELGITIAPFHSFPEIGAVHDHPRFR